MPRSRFRLTSTNKQQKALVAPALTGTLLAQRLRSTSRSMSDVELHSAGQILDVSDTPSAIIDSLGRCLYSNHAMQELSGLSATDRLNQLACSNPAALSIWQSVVSALPFGMPGDRPQTVAGFQQNDTLRRPLDIEVKPYLSASGEITAYTVIARHTSEAPFCDSDTVSHRFLRALDFFSGGFALYDKDDRKLVFNKTFRDIHDFLGDDFKVGMTFQECIALQISAGRIPAAIGNEEAFIAKRAERFHNPSGPFEVQKSGNKWYRVTEQRLDDGGCLQTMEDISEMKITEIALKTSEKRFRDFAETAADLFWEADTNMQFSYLSGQSSEPSGEKRKTKIDLDMHDYDAFKNDPSVLTQLDSACESKDSFDDIIMSFDRSDETQGHLSVSGRPLFDETDTFIGYRGVARDITEARELTNQLHYQARHDPLTTLINRREFNEQVISAQREAKQHNLASTLAFIDLDQFKIVNDTEGHPAGDRLLKELSKYLSDKLRSSDVLARLGGDEFGLLLKGSGIDEGKIIVANLMAALRDFRFVSNSRGFDVTASVGLVEINSRYASLDDLSRQVDIACYAAKDLGRNQIHVYDLADEEIQKRSRDVVHASDIQQALRNNQFVLFSQPIVHAEASTQSPTHFEILVRMLADDGTLLMPNTFIPVAEKYRLMADIDRWVIQNTLRTLKDAPSRFNKAQFTVNLSGESLTDLTLVDDIKTAIELNNIDPHRIVFEITETAVVTSFDKAREFTNQLTTYGCNFAIDDFGSGRSTFSYLKKFDAKYLKIDGSLIREIVCEHDDRTMVSAINEMAHILGMETIAEFVENQDIVDVLRDIGVDMLQGYGIGKPTPLSKVLAGTATQETKHLTTKRDVQESLVEALD